MSGSGGQQLSLGFDHRPALGSADFLVAECNREAVAWCERWPEWPGPALVLVGPPGCGKTHLLEVFKEQNGARSVTAADLRSGEPPALVGDAAVCVVDDADAAAAAGHEEALLHLYNWVREQGRHLLLTAHRPPARWGVALPDLASRLNTAPVVEIGPPDDSLFSAVLVKLFADRQLKVDAEVVPYLTARIERSFAAAGKWVSAIDAEALAEHRNITVPFVRGVLASSSEK